VQEGVEIAAPAVRDEGIAFSFMILFGDACSNCVGLGLALASESAASSPKQKNLVKVRPMATLPMD